MYQLVINPLALGGVSLRPKTVGSEENGRKVAHEEGVVKTNTERMVRVLQDKKHNRG